jgi:hypothetical protein
LFTSSVNDIGCKVIAGIVDTCGKFTANLGKDVIVGVTDTGDKFADRLRQGLITPIVWTMLAWGSEIPL